MDTEDVSEKHRVALMKRLEAAMSKAAERKGQLVTDHPDPEALVEAFQKESNERNRTVENTRFPLTQIPDPYKPCVTPEKDLEPMSISDMRLETHHRGKKVFLRAKTEPTRITAVLTIVEDEEGTAVLLALHQQPQGDSLTARHPGIGSVAILKDPFFEQTVEGGYALQVDHPSDIIWLKDHDERIPEQWRINRKFKNSSEHRAKGEKLASRKEWLPALHSYTLALNTAESPDEKQQALLRRSAINLKLDRPRQALLDATEGNGLATSTEESLLQQARAIYHLGKFEECKQKLLTLLKAFPKSVDATIVLLDVQYRLDEQKTGNYPFDKMLNEAWQTPPLIDRATFSSFVEIRNAPGRGKGLFLTNAVSAGDLILCEKAFSYCFLDDDKSHELCPIMLNMSTKEMKTGGSAYLLPQLTQKLLNNPEHIRTFQDLFHGDHEKLQVTECDGSPVVDSFMVERIMHYNAVNSPRFSSNHFERKVFRKKGNSLEVHNNTTSLTSGIWLLASRINHSCVSNCRRSFIGDMQIISATEDMPAGTELLLSYRTPSSFESYEDVQRHLSTWGFKCTCDLCKDRSKEKKAVLEKRHKIFDEASDLLKTEALQFNFAKARTLVKQMENTYHGKPANKVRLELSEICFGMSNLYKESGMPADFARMIIKSLESLGFVIVAYVPDQRTVDYRFEVKKWGLSSNYAVYLFLNLAELYTKISRELFLRAFYYAELSYKMLVGETVSMPQLFPKPS